MRLSNPAVVKSQVSSQIKVRDLSQAMVSVQPADESSWSSARADIIVTAKRPLKAQLAAELASCATDEESAEVRARFEAAERDLEHSIGKCRRIFKLDYQIPCNDFHSHV